MIEVNSEISCDVKECRQSLQNRINSLVDVAKELKVFLATSGTHPFQQWSERLIFNDPRYHELHKKYQWLVRRMNVYGLHVHVGLPTRDQALKVSNYLIRYLPHLLALSANSPFWQGVDTGMQSSRMNIIESFPFSGIPPQFHSWEEFEQYYATLTRAEAIQSTKDLYWFVRPNLEFGTIEVRICDALSTLNETMAIVALIQCLVVYISETIEDCFVWNKEQEWIVPENQWNAARYGLNGTIVDRTGRRQSMSESIAQLVDQLSAISKRLNCEEELQYIHQILRNGNGAQRQCKVFEQTNSLYEVVRLSMEGFHTWCAEREGKIKC
jgi:carboxylate-amine ligase